MAGTILAAFALVCFAGAQPPARAESPPPHAVTPPPPRPGTPAALWLEAHHAVRGDEAAASYRTLAERYPRHPLGEGALCELADYQYARGEYDAARMLYRRVRGSEARRARFGEALATFALGDPAQAREQARALLRERNDPMTWRAALLVAQSWEAERRVPETLAAYRRLLELPAGAGQPTALLGAARAAERAGEQEEAARYLLALRERYPESSEAAEARSSARPPADLEAAPALRETGAPARTGRETGEHKGKPAPTSPAPAKRTPARSP